MSCGVIGVRCCEVRFTLKNRRRQPGLSGPKSAVSGNEGSYQLSVDGACGARAASLQAYKPTSKLPGFSHRLQGGAF